jgi:replicative DNA helicase
MTVPDLRLDAGLPANIDAEVTILGAVLLDNAAFEEAAEKIQSDDFSLDSHRRIFLRMADLMRTRRSVDIVTLAHELSKHKEIESIGGVAYLASLTEGLPRRPVIGEYIRIVKDKSLLRRLMGICSMAIARAADQGESALELLSVTMQNLSDIESSGMQGSDLESVGQWLSKNDVFEERKPGIFTGIDDYDQMTFGLHPEELTIIAARTSMGKTAHCGTITWKMAVGGKCVAAFINEQSKHSFIGRMLCGRSGVSFKSYQRGQMDWVEKQYIQDAEQEFRKLPIFWDQRSSMSVASIRAKAARLKRSGELDVILVDQLSRVSAEGIYQKGMRGDEVIGEKVSALKGIAVDLQVPLVLYHQVGRGAIKNQDSRPTLADLAESGKIEQHADNVAFLHRPGYYNRDDESLKYKAEIFIAKQRDGETGSVECEFVGYNCLWRNKSK